jgi:uncharacterized protein YndB with AHSA1/START domain
MSSTNTIHKTIEINAPVAKVWQAITDPALISKWWFETPIDVKTTWQPGNDIVFTGIWYGAPYKDKGIVLAFEAEKQLKFNYLSHIANLPDVTENYTVIGFDLTPSGNQTILTLTQTNFAMESMYQHWNFYWLVTLDILKKFVEL